MKKKYKMSILIKCKSSYASLNFVLLVNVKILPWIGYVHKNVRIPLLISNIQPILFPVYVLIKLFHRKDLFHLIQRITQFPIYINKTHYTFVQIFVWKTYMHVNRILVNKPISRIHIIFRIKVDKKKTKQSELFSLLKQMKNM